MTFEEFKLRFDSDERPIILCRNVQEQLDTYMFLHRIGYTLNAWERGFVAGTEADREIRRRDFMYPIHSWKNGFVSTSCRSPKTYDIQFDQIASLVYGFRIEKINVPDLDKLLGGF